MAYATVSELMARYRDDVAIVTASEADLQNALDDASADVDTYLARYAMPLALVPPKLARVTCDLAQYLIVGTDGAMMTDERRRRYDDAIGWLTMVATGKLDISSLVTPPVDTDGDGQSDGAATAEVISNPRLFTRTGLDGLL